MSWTASNEQPVSGHRAPVSEGRVWLGRGLLVLSIAGLPLSVLALSRLGRTGRLVLQAACTLLFARAIQFVASGAPSRLRKLPSFLSFVELAIDGLATATGFWTLVWQPFVAARFKMHRSSRVSQRVERLHKLSVAAMFVLHTVRMAIYVSPGQGRRDVAVDSGQNDRSMDLKG